MFLAIFLVLLIMWLLGWAAFHIAGGLIHLLLILAIVSIVVHPFRGRRVVESRRIWALACQHFEREFNQ